MEKKIILILLVIFLLGTSSLFAAETVKKKNAMERIVSIESRGVVNFLSSPGEFVYALKGEMKDHPKAWPATYVPRLFTNLATRVASSVNDLLILPFYARAANDDKPLTRRFDLPDYAWEKE